MGMSEVAFVQPDLTPVMESPSLAAMQPMAGVLLWRCRYCRKTWQDAFGIEPYQSRRKFCCKKCSRDSDYAKNRDNYISRSRERYYRDIEKTHNVERMRYVENRNRMRAQRKIQWHKHKSDWNKLRSEKNQNLYRALKEEMLAKYKNKCNHCGDIRIPVLTVDHVAGDGAVHRKKTGNGITFLREVISDNSGRFQLLCMNCQWIKRHANSENKKPRLLLGAADE